MHPPHCQNWPINQLASGGKDQSPVTPWCQSKIVTAAQRYWSFHHISKKVLGRINDFVLTVNMAALLCTPLLHCYGCKEAMNSCWSTTFYAAHLSKCDSVVGSGNKWTERTLDINSCVISVWMEEVHVTAISGVWFNSSWAFFFSVLAS